MSERHSSGFDDHAAPPRPPADPRANGDFASGPPPLRSPSDNVEPPVSDENLQSGDLAQPEDTTEQLEERAASHQADRPHSNEETTAVIDSSTTAGWTRERGAARRSGEPFGQPPGREAPPARPGTHRVRNSPPWQQPPTGEEPDDEQGWAHAQGSAANWNYVDAIRSAELVPTRRVPPRRGWRKAVYVGSFKLINLGQSPDERYQAELEGKVRSLLRGKYKIGVLGKGGVGKSTIAASVGSVFAELRQDDRVVAIDADTAFGRLASRIDPSASGSYWELAGDRYLNTFADIRSRVGSNSAGLFVLPGEAATARRRVLDPAVYREATAALDRHFTLSIVDCGSTLDSPVTREVLGDVDALIVVSSPWFDGASAAGQILEYLANGGYTGLLHRTVVVLNDSDGHAAKRDRQLLVERFGGRGQKVIEMPYDEHLRPGGVIDVENEMNSVTRRRVLELAAACAEHFAATADRPRRSR